MNENSSLSFKNIFKRETKLAVYIIVCMTIVVASVSYALFFQVTNNSNNQIVEAGDLVFTYSNGNQITQEAKNICFQPMSLEEANLYYDECAYDFSVTNTGSLKANYSISLEGSIPEDQVGSKKKLATGGTLQVILKKKSSEGDVLEPVAGFPKAMEEDGNMDLESNIELDSGETVTYQIQIYVDESYEDIENSVGDIVNYRIHGKGVVHEDQELTSPTE